MLVLGSFATEVTDEVKEKENKKLKSNNAILIGKLALK